MSLTLSNDDIDRTTGLSNLILTYHCCRVKKILYCRCQKVTDAMEKIYGPGPTQQNREYKEMKKDNGYLEIFRSSTSNLRTEFGGITGGKPRPP